MNWLSRLLVASALRLMSWCTMISPSLCSYLCLHLRVVGLSNYPKSTSSGCRNQVNIINGEHNQCTNAQVHALIDRRMHQCIGALVAHKQYSLLAAMIGMRREIIKILQKPNQYTHRHTPQSQTHPIKYDHNIAIHDTTEDLEFHKLKHIIDTTSTPQTHTLINKVRAVQRVSCSHQKNRQQPSKRKNNKQQQHTPKLTDTTHSCPNYVQDRVGIEAERQSEGGKQGKVKKDYQQLLQMQIQLLSDELRAMKLQEQVGNKHVLSLRFENNRLRALLSQKDAQIANLRKINQQMQIEINSGRMQLQAQIEQLITQNDQNRTSNVTLRELRMCGQTVKLSVVANQPTNIGNRGKTIQQQFTSLEHKYNAMITQLKTKHEQEITNLRKIMFDNINYYRQLSKTSTTLLAKRPPIERQPILPNKQSSQWQSMLPVVSVLHAGSLQNGGG